MDFGAYVLAQERIMGQFRWLSRLDARFGGHVAIYAGLSQETIDLMLGPSQKLLGMW